LVGGYALFVHLSRKWHHAFTFFGVSFALGASHAFYGGIATGLNGSTADAFMITHVRAGTEHGILTAVPSMGKLARV
jgi:hypothetical protein